MEVRSNTRFPRLAKRRSALFMAIVTVFAIFSIGNSVRGELKDPGALYQRFIELYRTGEFGKAVPLAERIAEIIRSRKGERHVEYATALLNLAVLYEIQARYPEAEPLYERALAIREKALGAEHPDVATVVHNLAQLYEIQARYPEAEPLYKRALAIRENALGAEHPDVALSLNGLAVLYQAQARYPEAEPLHKRALAIQIRALGAQHSEVGTSLNNLAELYKAQGRLTKVEPLYKRALAIWEKVRGAKHPSLASILNNLAALYRNQGRHAEAEPLYKRALAIHEEAFGAGHPRVATSVNNLANFYRGQGRNDEAEQLHKRALAIRKRVFGPEHPDVATSLNNLAGLYNVQGRYAEAEQLYERTLAIREKTLGAEHPDVATSLNNLAALYWSQRRFAQAVPLFTRALTSWEKALGAEHPNVAAGLSTLAGLYWFAGYYAEAEPLFKRAFAIREKAFGAEHPSVAESLNSLAFNHFAQEEWAPALAYFRRGTEIVITNDRRLGSMVGEALGGERTAAAVSSRHSFVGLVRAAEHLTGEAVEQRSRMTEEAYRAAQRVQGSRTAQALAQMAARFAAGDTRLSGLVRERQDLVRQWRTVDKRLIAAVSVAMSKRNAGMETTLRGRLARIDDRVANIDRTLGAEFPEYAGLVNPDPLSIQATQALLGRDEALLVFLDAPATGSVAETGFVWSLTATDVKWRRLSVGPKSLKDKIGRLREGLLGTQAHDISAPGLGQAVRDGLAAAHEIYTELLAPVASLIEGKQLLIVPSGSLTSLPWHLLLREAYPADRKASKTFAKAAWLVRRHAVTVLPSVASLMALRENTKASLAQFPFIGIGNPLLKGPSGRDERAARFKSCADWDGRFVVAKRSGTTSMTSLFRGAVADVTRVRRLEPLPETVGELCSVGSSLGASENAIMLGAAATESALNALSASAKLANYRVVHFATHGLVTGELNGLAEPALVLTPPDKASESDDGLLTASEVTQLRLDAQWVILSACNTAAGDKGNAEALSGLARAFFYAGARALLVSHWPVNSQAAVELTTGTFEMLKTDPGLGRAEALRRAMLSLIGSGVDYKAQPSYWAPFVVVGEGRTDLAN